jgi:hypothetical protein
MGPPLLYTNVFSGDDTFRIGSVESGEVEVPKPVQDDVDILLRNLEEILEGYLSFKELQQVLRPLRVIPPYFGVLWFTTEDIHSLDEF